MPVPMPLFSALGRVSNEPAFDILPRSRRGSAQYLRNAVLPDRGCCFTFHRAVHSQDWKSMPNRGFHIDIGYLERLLVHLITSGWHVVTIEEAIRRAADPNSHRFVNFSIDDCYRDTADIVVPLFQRLGVPITLYVTTGIPDATMRLRDAGLETILGREDVVTEQGETFRLDTRRRRRAAFAKLSQRWHANDDVAAYLRFCERHGYDPDILDTQHAITWPMLEAMLASPYVEIGSHTVSHPRVSALSQNDAFAELLASRERLEEKLGLPVRHFAFTYGRRGDCSARDFALVKQAGYMSAATTRKGLMGPSTERYCLPRNTLNGAHRNLALAYAHLSGLSGIATQVLGRG